MLSIHKTLIVSARQILLTGMLSTVCALFSQTAPTNPTYSNASLQGNFVLSESGLNLQSQANYAGVSVLNLDGSGNVAGTAYLVAGAYSAAGNAVTGTYSVGSNGWGTVSLATTDAYGNTSLANYSILLASKGIMITRTDNGMFSEAALATQARANFSNANANGSFVLQERGFSANGPCGLMGQLTLDGFGNVTGTASFQSLGMSFSTLVSGTYAINPDGSGNLNLSLSVTQPDGSISSTNLTYSLLMIDSSGKAMGISADPGTTAIASMTAR
jgi:hypothetical protein